ncbi:uncharacterized protein [Argopecten irradians]|uniref:uncharacterized protein n=1 Tax=Argopecten irradians TaxID=31199 RepID=UPI0037201B56
MDLGVWFSGLLLWITLNTYRCQNYQSYTYQAGKALAEPGFLNLTLPDMSTCFSLCQQIIKCDSVSFDTNSKECQMNAENSVSGSISSKSGYLFSDVTTSATLVGGCATSSCALEEICIMDANGGMAGCAMVQGS